MKGKGFKAKSNTPRISVRNSPHIILPHVPSHQSPRTYWRPPPALPACCRAPEVQVAQRRRPSWLRLLCWWWSLSPPGLGCGLEKQIEMKIRHLKYKNTYLIFGFYFIFSALFCILFVQWKVAHKAWYITELKLHIFNKTAWYFDLSGITFSGSKTDIHVWLLIFQKNY